MNYIEFVKGKYMKMALKGIKVPFTEEWESAMIATQCLFNINSTINNNSFVSGGFADASAATGGTGIILSSSTLINNYEVFGGQVSTGIDGTGGVGITASQSEIINAGYIKGFNGIALILDQGNTYTYESNANITPDDIMAFGNIHCIGNNTIILKISLPSPISIWINVFSSALSYNSLLCIILIFISSERGYF